MGLNWVAEGNFWVREDWVVVAISGMSKAVFASQMIELLSEWEFGQVDAVVLTILWAWDCMSALHMR